MIISIISVHKIASSREANTRVNRGVPPWKTADATEMDAFAMTSGLAKGSSYNWGFVEWYQAAKVTASVPLVHKNGSLTGERIYTKAAGSTDYANKQGIDYFPNTVPAGVDMTSGAAEEMTIMLDNKQLFYVFELGTSALVPDELPDADDWLNLDFSYTLDRGVVVGLLNEAWADNTPGAACTRNAAKTTVTCGNSRANIISLNDNAAALEIRVPPVLPLVYRVKTQGVIRATYKIEVPADRPVGAVQVVGSFDPRLERRTVLK